MSSAAAKYVTLAEASRILNITEYQVRRLIKSRQLVGYRLTPGRWHLAVADVEAYAQSKAAAMDGGQA